MMPCTATTILLLRYSNCNYATVLNDIIYATHYASIILHPLGPDYDKRMQAESLDRKSDLVLESPNTFDLCDV